MLLVVMFFRGSALVFRGLMRDRKPRGMFNPSMIPSPANRCRMRRWFHQVLGVGAFDAVSLVDCRSTMIKYDETRLKPRFKGLFLRMPWGLVDAKMLHAHACDILLQPFSMTCGTSKCSQPESFVQG